MVPMVSLLHRFTVQDSSLWSQWCPYYRGSLYRTAHCGPSGVLITGRGSCSLILFVHEPTLNDFHIILFTKYNNQDKLLKSMHNNAHISCIC